MSLPCNSILHVCLSFPLHIEWVVTWWRLGWRRIVRLTQNRILPFSFMFCLKLMHVAYSDGIHVGSQVAISPWNENSHLIPLFCVTVREYKHMTSGGWIKTLLVTHPLVMTKMTMENHHPNYSWENALFLWLFMAMFNGYFDITSLGLCRLSRLGLHWMPLQHRACWMTGPAPRCCCEYRLRSPSLQ